MEWTDALKHSIRFMWSEFQKSALYQGTTSVVPKSPEDAEGFNP